MAHVGSYRTGQGQERKLVTEWIGDGLYVIDQAGSDELLVERLVFGHRAAPAPVMEREEEALMDEACAIACAYRDEANRAGAPLTRKRFDRDAAAADADRVAA
jgi:hypothetical protein